MRYLFSITIAFLLASTPPLAQGKSISYPYYASAERTGQIRDNYQKIKTDMTAQLVKTMLGEPDETLPLYEPKIKHPKQIGHTCWYLIQRKTDKGSVNDRDEKLVRVSYDLNWIVTGTDHWGFDENIQKNQDYWCPIIDLLGKAAESFTLANCEYISGITIKLTYTGAYPYPSKLKFTLLDADGRPMKSDQSKHVFGPDHLEKGQYGIFTIQYKDNGDPSKIEIEGVW